MYHLPIADWDDAYANGPNIPRGEAWPAAWMEPASAFREKLAGEGRAELDREYGPRPRNRFDLFLPQGEPKGIVVYVHGGFWLRFDKSLWSHFASGCVEAGYAVAMPSYTLCPEVRIADITVEVGQAITAAAKLIAGPIYLAGHSAGGHLVTRMISATSPLPTDVAARIGNTLSISGVHDLRPIMKTAMNAGQRIDEAEAIAESPVLLRPIEGKRLTCWVGAGERAEFIRQNALLANIWAGLGAITAVVEEPDRHHFNIVDGLATPGHPMLACLIG